MEAVFFLAHTTMRCLLFTLLILLQGSRCLACPHVHAEGGAAEPADHARRPHLHLGGWSSQHHGHKQPAPAEGHGAEALSDSHHDSDAVYVADDTLSDRTASRPQTLSWHHLPCLPDATPSPRALPGSAAPPWPFPAPGAEQGRCPLYLQTLALLI